MRRREAVKPVQAPEPPSMKRFVKVERLQLIGVPILATVALAGLFGAFDDTSARGSAGGSPLAMHVEFPSRVQFEQSKPLTIEVRNESSDALGEVAVEIDRAYLDGFQPRSFLPEPDQITPAAYVVALGTVQAGEVRRVVLEVRPETIGRRQGAVRVTAEGRRLATIDLSTFVFP